MQSKRSNDKKEINKTKRIDYNIIIAILVTVVITTVISTGLIVRVKNAHSNEIDTLNKQINDERLLLVKTEAEKEEAVVENIEIVKEIKIIENETKKKTKEIETIKNEKANIEKELKLEKEELEKEIEKEKKKVKTLSEKAISRTSDNKASSHKLVSDNTQSSTRSSVSRERVITGEATAYGASVLNGGAGSGITATGVTPIEGRTIAVDKRLIPLGSKVRITCDSYPSINGVYIAEDVGGAIKGNRVDIYFNDLTIDKNKTRTRMLDFGRRKVKIEIIK